MFVTVLDNDLGQKQGNIPFRILVPIGDLNLADVNIEGLIFFF